MCLVTDTLLDAMNGNRYSTGELSKFVWVVEVVKLEQVGSELAPPSFGWWKIEWQREAS